MTMGVSFKVSKKGTRFRPKPKPDLPQNNNDDVDAPPETLTTKPSVDVAENGKDDSEISDADISFFINLFSDGYSIGNPSENRIAVQDDPKFLHPYDRTSESLFLAIERGLLPADFLDDIPCKYINGAVACEVRDYRNCASEPGVNGSSADSSSPITTKIRLKMSLENVVKDIPLISDSSWTYGDLMEAEARILIALHPKLDIDPTPNLDRLCRPPTCTNLNLNIRELRRKRLRQMTGPDNSVHGKKVCMDRVSENPSSSLMMQPTDLVNLTTQNVAYQSKYQTGAGNTRVMQDHGPGPVQDMMNSYPDGMNTNMGKRENQDGPLSPMTGLTKRARSNSMGQIQDGSQQQMDGLNSLMQHQQNQQSIGRGMQLPYNAAGIQKYPFDGSFNQEQFTMGQSGMRYNLKQEPVDPELNRNMHMVDSDVDPRIQQQQRLTQQFARSSFPPTPWNNNTMDNSRKEEQFQRRKSAQSPRVSSGALPQSPLSSKSGEFSSGSHGGQYGAPMGSSQRDKSAVTSVSIAGGAASLTSNAQAAARRSNSLPKTPAAMSGVGSPASVGNISGPGPFNAASPLVGKEADKSMRDRFAKIEALTVRYQLNLKKNKVDEYSTNMVFSTQQLNHHLLNDLNTENPKDEDCKMPLSKSLVGGSMNVCKTRVLNFVQTERVLQGNGFTVVPKVRTRMILSEKRDDGTVAMHYGELDDCDYLASEECLPTLPNTHVADLLAAQFCTLILREGYHVEGDHLQPKPTNTVRSSGDQQNNNTSGVLSPNTEMPETVSGQTSNEVAKPTDSGTNNNNASVNSSGARMHPPTNSQPLQIPQGSGLLPPARPLQPESQPSFQQNQLMQQQIQRSSAMMLASNSLSQLNVMGQNSNMQQLGHMLNKSSPLQLQMLQQQQQQQQQPQMQRKMMMGLGNVGMGGSTGNNNMVGLQGMGNMMGGNRGISPPMTGVLTGMGNNMGQNPINMNMNMNNQASNISNVISQQLRSGMITPAQAQMMTAKLRMVQNRSILGGAQGQSGNITGMPGANRQVLPGSSNYSMLGPGMNRATTNTMNPMQRTAMAPPKLISGMNVYMNQQQQQQQQQQQLPHQQQQMHMQQQQQQQLPHQQQQQQESTSPLQAVLSPPQQVGSPSMGLPQQQQQASPQQMSQRTPMSPQLSSGAIQPPMSAGNQEALCPASPQLSSQTMGSVSSMTNSPMDMQGVNKSS
ncbi:putative transcription factor Spt20 [Helianthus annuus]|nr:putative transcription factor Spt20 [Helianthus annuus]